MERQCSYDSAKIKESLTYSIGIDLEAKFNVVYMYAMQMKGNPCVLFTWLAHPPVTFSPVISL